MLGYCMRPLSLTLNLIEVDPARPEPLQQQIYRGLREAIIRRQLPAGGRLPATRELARRWQVSRNTVAGAFDQLMAEGYLEGRTGSGTYVRAVIPDSYFRATQAPRQQSEGLASRRAELVQRRQAGKIPGNHQPFPHLPLRPTTPSLEDFPLDLWEQCRRAVLREGAPSLLTYSPTAGYWPLRRTLAAYLRDSRGVTCEPEQIILCCGSQQGIFLSASLVLEPGEVVWLEDPTYDGAHMVYQRLGARIVPVPVDQAGMDVGYGIAKLPPARLIHVSPSHQFPLGTTLSLERRMMLLDYANQSGAYVLEDDYDSEYRYQGRPLASLQGLDQAASTIYVGTFSKVLFPSLRLGYLVAPPSLVDLLTAVRASTDACPTLLDPATLALFMEEGHFARHIRRMRALYQERLDVLEDAVRRRLGGVMRLEKGSCGMHAVGWLTAGWDDREVSAKAAAAGLLVPALSRYRLQHAQPPGLLLGFAGFRPPVIQEAIEKLAQVMGN